MARLAKGNKVCAHLGDEDYYVEGVILAVSGNDIKIEYLDDNEDLCEEWIFIGNVDLI